MRYLCTLLACTLLPASLCAATTLEARISGVSGSTGTIRVAVCDRERFLKECAYSASAPARAGETVLSLKDIPPGNWAVLAYQDDNDNGELDRNMLGIPKENYGFSRDAASRFGPPGFDAAAIEVREARTVVPIRLR